MNFSDVQDTNFQHNLSLNCRGKIIPLSTPLVMGIINCTPDSFHSNSRAQTIEAAIQMAKKHLNEGASILDIGAYSSRPGSESVSLDEELNRIVPAVEALREHFPDAIISIDSFRPEVIESLIPIGIDIVNDITGNADEKLLKLISGKNIPYILMHNQESATYNNISAEIYQFFQKKIELINKFKINDVIIDLGFGFAKTLEHNYELLNATHFFTNLHLPILIGVSRKSMIYKLLNCTPAEALNGTTVIHSIALTKGGNILRVHDVKEAKEAIDIFMKMKAL